MMETNAQYHADTTRNSNSMLSTLKESPKLYHGVYIAKTMKPKERTKAMLFGDLTHTAFLEPDFFWERYVTAPENCDRRTTVGKATWAAFQETLNGREIIKHDDYKKAFACAKALREHDEIGSLDISKSIVETRINFEFLGLPMRCKPDLAFPSFDLIVDLKTAKDPSKDGFTKSVLKFGYHRQQFLYSTAYEQQYGRKCRFLFAVVGSDSPHDVGCYELEPDLLQIGAEEAEMLVTQLQHRIKTGDWLQAWSRGVVGISKPRWHKNGIYALDELDEEEESEEVAA